MYGIGVQVSLGSKVLDFLLRLAGSRVGFIEVDAALTGFMRCIERSGDFLLQQTLN